jgi:hypothetical protein
MKKYTKKEMEAMTTLSQEITARLHNLSLDRLQIAEIVEFVKDPNTKRKIRESLTEIYIAVEEAKDLAKEVR